VSYTPVCKQANDAADEAMLNSYMQKSLDQPPPQQHNSQPDRDYGQQQRTTDLKQPWPLKLAIAQHPGQINYRGQRKNLEKDPCLRCHSF
jgi:hypothetical protein